MQTDASEMSQGKTLYYRTVVLILFSGLIITPHALAQAEVM